MTQKGEIKEGPREIAQTEDKSHTGEMSLARSKVSNQTKEVRIQADENYKDEKQKK